MRRPLVRETRTVDITAEDIKAGKPKACSLCPGALAVRRAFPEAKHVDVMTDEVEVLFSRSDHPVLLREAKSQCPEVLKSFIQDFDANREVFPVSFPMTFSLEEPECLP